jgi:hypothetical protein
MTSTTSSYLKNFPFPIPRQNQEKVLLQIEEAFNSGTDFVICECATGFGKSGVAIAAGLTEGSSYICTSTKNLQLQYKTDFKWVQMAKGRNNFQCPMIEKDAFCRSICCSCNSSRSLIVFTLRDYQMIVFCCSLSIWFMGAFDEAWQSLCSEIANWQSLGL